MLQSIENEDSNRFSCAGNYNLTVSNYTCENISHTLTSTIMPTTATSIPSLVSTTTKFSGFPMGYEIQCGVIQDDDSQENHYTCSEGFNLTINNLTCNNSIHHAVVQNNATTYTSEQIQASTIIVFTILILIIAIQAVIIIIILILLLKLKGIKLAKNPKVHQNMCFANFQESVAVPLEEIIEKQSNILPNTRKHSDLMKVNPTYENIGVKADHTYENVD